MKPTIKIREVAGIISAMRGMRFPTKTVHRSDTVYDQISESILIGEKDMSLAQSLIAKGPVHAKHQRGIMAWLEINMPRYIWSELDTYNVGVSPISSESSMYTLEKDLKTEDFANLFAEGTPQETIDYYYNFYKKYGGTDLTRQTLKMGLPEAWVQRRIKVFSYQTLRNMYFDRRDHRLPEWQIIVETIKQLPYAEEFITKEF